MADRGAERGDDAEPGDRGASSESSMFTSGARIGRYQLCYELASGGMAKVYLARVSGAAGFEKLVALKHIHSHLAERRDFVEMFMDEARIASRISHPNVCTVFDFGSAGRDHFIAMEYLAGETLGRISRRVSREPARLSSPAWWATALRIVADACEGLHAAHELRNDAGDLLQVIHRDVSPANIFVTYDGTVKVVDFGVARANERTHQTSAGQVKGHYAYMAPEHARGKTMDRRADIWSMGVVLFELLAGRRMMDMPNDAAILMSLLAGEVPSLSEVRAGLPDHLYAIVSRTLSMDPAGRPATARELARELERSIQKIGEPAGRSEVEELMQTLFATERQRRIALMAKARKMAPGQSALSEDDSERIGAATISAERSAPGEASSHVRRAPDETAEIALPDIELDPFEAELTTVSRPGDEIQAAPRRRLTREQKIALGASGGALALVLMISLAVFAWSDGEAVDEVAAPVAPIAAVALPTPSVPEPVAIVPVPEPTVVEPVAIEPVAIDPVADAVGADPGPIDVAGPGPITPDVRDVLAQAPEAPAVHAAPRRAHVRPREPAAMGTVNVVTPGGWAEIYEGSRRIGRSPARIELPAGRHTLELRAFGTGARHRVSVTVTANETTRVAQPVSP